MKKNDLISRRNFLAKSTLSTGIIGMGALGTAEEMSEKEKPVKNGSPREVFVLSTTNDKFDPNEDNVKQMLERMNATSSYKPDIICLPEAFANSDKNAEDVPGPITNQFCQYAKKHQCYIICTLYTKRNSKKYNTAVLIDRNGNIIGMYNKIHPTEGECDSGVVPGNSPPPVFETDFGKIGILICFDINWHNEWKSLKEQGAEIVFWTSVFPGGRLLSSYARLFHYYVVGCSRSKPALVYDLAGDLISKSGKYEGWALASLNLEKIHCEIDFHIKKVKKIRQKYGRKVKVVYYHDEDWVTIESCSPDLTIKQIIDEFKLVNHWDYIKRAEKYQDKFRSS
jgi:predicted amidohydrolase